MKTKRVLAIVFVLLGLAACGVVGGESAAMGDDQNLVVTGELTYRERMALPPGSVAVVTVVDVSIADRESLTLVEQRIELAGRQVPIPFSIAVDRRALKPGMRYAVRGVIRGADETLLWTTDSAHLLDPESARNDLGTLVLVKARSRDGDDAGGMDGLDGTAVPAQSTR